MFAVLIAASMVCQTPVYHSKIESNVRYTTPGYGLGSQIYEIKSTTRPKDCVRIYIIQKDWLVVKTDKGLKNFRPTVWRDDFKIGEDLKKTSGKLD